MARDHFISPTVPDEAAIAVRYGAGSGTLLTQAEVGKFAKLVTESCYDNCVVGDAIEAVVFAIELAPQNGFTIGSVLAEGTVNVIFDGLQGTPGTGTMTLGALVVTGTPVAKGTALTTYPKVCKATSQAAALFNWRVVSLGSAGTGAVGTTGVISRV